MKINRADRVVHLHAVRDECIAYAIPMQRPVPVPVSGRSPALLSDPSGSERASERASEEEEAARRRGERGRKKKPRRRRRRRRRILSSGFSQAFAFFSPISGRGVGDTSKTDRAARREIEIFQGEEEGRGREREREGGRPRARTEDVAL